VADYTFPAKSAAEPLVPPLQERMTPAAVAEYLDVSEATLRNWRSEQRGPAYFRLGRVFYWRRDVDRWFRSRRVEPREVSRDVTHRRGRLRDT
jgi:hypothetical protein